MMKKHVGIKLGDLGTCLVTVVSYVTCSRCSRPIDTGMKAWRTRRKPVLSHEKRILGLDGVVETWRCARCYERANEPTQKDRG